MRSEFQLLKHGGKRLRNKLTKTLTNHNSAECYVTAPGGGSKDGRCEFFPIKTLPS